MPCMHQVSTSPVPALLRCSMPAHRVADAPPSYMGTTPAHCSRAWQALELLRSKDEQQAATRTMHEPGSWLVAWSMGCHCSCSRGTGVTFRQQPGSLQALSCIQTSLKCRCSRGHQCCSAVAGPSSRALCAHEVDPCSQICCIPSLLGPIGPGQRELKLAPLALLGRPWVSTPGLALDLGCRQRQVPKSTLKPSSTCSPSLCMRDISLPALQACTSAALAVPACSTRLELSCRSVRRRVGGGDRSKRLCRRPITAAALLLCLPSQPASVHGRKRQTWAQSQLAEAPMSGTIGRPRSSGAQTGHDSARWRSPRRSPSRRARSRRPRRAAKTSCRRWAAPRSQAAGCLCCPGAACRRAGSPPRALPGDRVACAPCPAHPAPSWRRRSSARRTRS